MPRRTRFLAGKLPDLTFALLAALLLILWVAGGASRADVLGQTVTRGGAWLIAIAALLFAPRPRWEAITPIVWFVIAAVLLVAIQLVPLPPDLWTSLPGREVLAQSAIASGQPQPWRPLSLSPGATANALSSLIVPVVVLFLAGGLLRDDHWRLVKLLLGLIVASCLVGLMQFSGSGFDNPLINGIPGSVSGMFANRNHFALLIACGCILAPVWAFAERRSPRWKALTAAGLLVMFVLMILATGSRAGMVLGALGVAIGFLAVRSRIATQIERFPRKIWIPVVLSLAGVFVVVITLSIMLDRAVSVDRALSLEGDDLRRLALPTILEMVSLYWPLGSGFGAFDPVYRISEPSTLLSTLYLNHAHNDLLEVVLDGGLPALLLLGAALAWCAWNSVRAWVAPTESRAILPRAGSGILALIIVASAVDYPARTPMIMALVVLAAMWLSTVRGSKERAQDERQSS